MRVKFSYKLENDTEIPRIFADGDKKRSDECWHNSPVRYFRVSYVFRKNKYPAQKSKHGTYDKTGPEQQSEEPDNHHFNAAFQ